MDGPEERLRSAADELAAGRAVVRAVIVKTWGSTPREVGADMTVDSQGGLQGTVGGGCGEAEVYELAQELLQQPRSLNESYLYHVDLTGNHRDGEEKVCGGRFDVLVQRLDPELHGPLAASARAVLDEGGQLCWRTLTGEQKPGFWKEGLDRVPVTTHISLLPAADQDPSWETTDGKHSFNEPLGRVQHLVIVGAGHIARPLCRLATEVGYRVTVLDDRADYAQAKHFPDAVEVVAGDYGFELPRLVSPPQSSVVLVTRGHRHDQDCLRLVIDKPLRYLGMIGSQRRIEAVFEELVQEGYSPKDLGKVYAPIGLEIGARTPAEIAISILAQMIKARREPSSPSRKSIDRKRHQSSLLPNPTRDLKSSL